VLYIAYLDEFGHIGPYVSRDDPVHRTSPVFGLGGIVLPAHNRIERDCGMVFYVGLQKTHSPDDHNPKRLYQSVLRESIKRLDLHFRNNNNLFMLVLDEQRETDLRARIVAEASREMFGKSRRGTLIEPPIQAESHLFQTLQCADWICGLVGRLGCHLVARSDYPELDWTTRYFFQRLMRIAPLSSIRRDWTGNPRGSDFNQSRRNSSCTTPADH
jgi:hypothetical protein